MREKWGSSGSLEGFGLSGSSWLGTTAPLLLIAAWSASEPSLAAGAFGASGSVAVAVVDTLSVCCVGSLAGLCSEDSSCLVNEGTPSLLLASWDALSKPTISAGASDAKESVSVAIVDNLPVCCVGSSANLSSYCVKRGSNW